MSNRKNVNGNVNFDVKVNSSTSGATKNVNLSKTSIHKKELSQHLILFSKEVQNQTKPTHMKKLSENVSSIITKVKEEEKQFANFHRNKNSILDCNFLKDPKSQRVPRRKSTTKQKKLSLNTYLDSCSSVEKKKEKEKESLKKSFHERGYAYQQKKTYDIETMRNKLRAEDMKNIKEKPEISKATQDMAEKLNLQPVYLRTKEDLEKKNNIIDNMKRMLYTTEKAKDNYSYPSASVQGSAKSCYPQKVLDWVGKQMEWKKKKDEKMDRIKTEMTRIATEAEDGYYHPCISQTSELLAKLRLNEKGDSGGKCLYERLYDEREELTMKHLKLMVENLPSFSPVLNSKENLNFTKSTRFNHTMHIPSHNTERTPQKRSNVKEVKTEKKKKQKQHQKALSPPVSKHEVRWEDAIKSVNHQNKSQADDGQDGLYKLNVRFASAWNTNRENKVYLKPNMEMNFTSTSQLFGK